MKKLMLTLALLVVASSNANPEVVKGCLADAKINVTDAQKEVFMGCLKDHWEAKKQSIMDTFKGFLSSPEFANLKAKFQDGAANIRDRAATMTNDDKQGAIEGIKNWWQGMMTPEVK